MPHLRPHRLGLRQLVLGHQAQEHLPQKLVGRRAMHAQAYLSGLGQQSFGFGHGRSVAAGRAGRRLWGLRTPGSR